MARDVVAPASIDPGTKPWRSDRAVGCPPLATQLRHLEKRVRQLEAALFAITTDRRPTPSPAKEAQSEQHPDR
jgi:hypothetical protein